MRKIKLFTLLLVILGLSLPAFGVYVAQDPTRYIPNARVLGLGKAYIGLADDAASMYTNPAGLAEAQGWQFTSMSGKFLDEYSFLSFSGLYPTNYGVLGVAFAGTSVSGALPTTIETGCNLDDPIYTVDTTQPQMGNYNNAYLLSYSNQANQLPWVKQIPEANKMSLGATLKLFRVALYGDGITGGDASGSEVDLGLKYQAQKWAKLGVALENILPSGMGGKLVYQSGHQESYPALFQLGSAFHLLGKKDALRTFGEHEVNLAVDYHWYPTLALYPATWHVGIEWSPLSIVTLRAGIDQDGAGDGAGGMTVVSDMAYGVGINMSGFKFDYAYHTFAGAPNIDNHYFSLSYEYQPPPVEIKEKFVIDEPADKLITFDEMVKVSGNILDPDVRRLVINDTATKFGLKGEFQTVLDLKLGKNRIAAAVLDNGGKTLQEKKQAALRLVTFPDVAKGYWVDKPISFLSMSQVLSGYPDGSFRPEGNITRAEICSVLIKTLSATSESFYNTFPDVPDKHWAASYITRAAALGVVKGYSREVAEKVGKKTAKKTKVFFKPNDKISRAEGLVIIARFTGVTQELYGAEFPDLGPRHWAANYVAGAYRVGMLDYLKTQNFDPNKKLTRAETVELLYRTAYMQDILKKDLLNWESY